MQILSVCCRSAKWWRRNITKTLMIMHLTGILLLTLGLQVTAKTMSQTVTLSGKNLSVRQVFEAVKKQTHYAIFYNKYLLKGTYPVSIAAQNMFVADFLSAALKDQPFEFYIENQNIIITRKPLIPDLIRELSPPPIDIKGTIVDEKGAPLVGVSIQVKGANIGTVTDNTGSFLITVKPGDVLVISNVGFHPQEIKVGSKTNYAITLIPSLNALTDVVVTGYTSQRMKDITGSVAVVDMKALKSIPSGSAVQALQGQASGVNIISSGAPGGSSNVFIRGVSSFGNNQPLVLMDGVEVNLDQVSANDIESVQVLKDAGAASIYGVRGANGVIIITSKKGKTGAPVISYDAFYGMQAPLKGNPFNLLNSENFAKLSKIAFPTSSLFANGLPDYIYGGPGATGTGMEGDPQVDPAKYNFDVVNPANNYIIQKVNKQGTDWFHEVFKPAPNFQQNLSVSGGNDKAKYMFGLGHVNQQGTLIESYYKRYSIRANTEFKVGKNIRIGENLYFYNSKNPGFPNLSEGNAISQVYRQMPIIPVYDIKGNFGGMFAGPDLGNAANPVAIQLRRVNDRNNVWSAVGNVFLEVDLLKHFTARTSYGGSVTNAYNLNFFFNRYNDREGYTSLSALTESSNYALYSIWTNTVNYSNSFGEHNLKVLVGSEAIENSGRSLSGTRRDFFSTQSDYLILNNGTQGLDNASNAYINTVFSLFSRLDYTLKDRYLLAATIRKDGSSRFGSEKRYGLFPSVSLGWRVTQESFMENISWLNDLKIRGSYGVLGSQNNVDPGNAFTLYNSGIGNSYYDIAGANNNAQQGFRQVSNGNPRTGWEKNIVTNVGFDATLLNNRVDVSIEYYKKSINGLLFPLPLPAIAGGAAPPTVNIGDIQNTGLDISAGYKGRINNDFNYSIGANITTYRNTVIDIPNPGYFETSGSRNGNLVRNQEGNPVSSFYGYNIIKIFSSDQEIGESPTQDGAAPGRFKYRDVNGDNAITPADRTFLGNPNPDFTYGINLGLNYKNFDFSTVIYGSQGNEVLNLVKWYTHFFSGFRQGKSNDLLNAWTPGNTNTNIPKIEATGSFSTSGVPNSFYIENGSFLKLKSIIFGYSIQPYALQKIGVNRFRFYFQAANLLTITKYSGLDPELGGNSSNFGVDYGNYPNNQKSFLLGLNLSF